MHTDLAARLRGTAPRYTSYPTAPHFTADVTAEIVEGWFAAIPDGDALSLYLHVPFCDRLCWFCACHTKHTLRYEPVAEYLSTLHAEIALAGKRAAGGVVRTVHFGGGSPTMLVPDDLKRLMDTLRSEFRFAEDASVSVEIDPNDIDHDRLDALAAIGLTRASIGIQDFDPKVQQAINREQSFGTTRAVVDGLRERGVRSVNLDLLYGLPHQTVDGVGKTIEQALTLRPDRMALFGYAHVPWFKKHQTMIDEAWLPGPEERLAQFAAASELIVEAGYVAIGLDHFALPGDSLAIAASKGSLRRNFQGYTDDDCETLIGLGPSSISRFRQGYAQNTPATPVYQQMVTKGRLPIAKGLTFSDEDRVRGWVIERLMCDYGFSAAEAFRRFGNAARPILAEAAALVQRGDLLAREDGFTIPRECRPFVRSIAAVFDAYLSRSSARHSLAV